MPVDAGAHDQVAAGILDAGYDLIYVALAVVHVRLPHAFGERLVRRLRPARPLERLFLLERAHVPVWDVRPVALAAPYVDMCKPEGGVALSVNGKRGMDELAEFHARLRTRAKVGVVLAQAA